ncbi:MAG: recombinase family protein [Planctomycetota bacterium]
MPTPLANRRLSGRDLPSKPARAVGYLRRSTDRQEQSIPDQKAAVEAYAEQHGAKLIDFYVDDAISGTSAVTRRAFQQMIKDAEGGGFDYVIVYDVKRFGRVDNDEAGYYRHLLKMHGVEVRYASEGFNGDSTDDLLRPVKQWQARQESKDLSKVTIRGLVSKMQGGGWWMGGAPPYGYDLRYEDAAECHLLTLRFLADARKEVYDDAGNLQRILERGTTLGISKQDRAKLVPSSAERVATVERVFKSYADGMGYKAIAAAINADKIPPARGPKWAKIYSGFWTDTTVRAMLLNPLYAGDMVWNRRTDARFHRIDADGRAVEREDIHGHRLVPNAPTDWHVCRDTHPALVSRHLLELCRQRRDSRPSSLEQRGVDPRTKMHGKTWRGQRSRFILSGLLACARCGHRYQGYRRRRGKSRSDGTKLDTFSYACGGYITKGASVCQLGAIPQAQLEEAVINAVLGYYARYEGPAGRQLLTEEVRNQLGVEDEKLAAAKIRLQDEEASVERRIEGLLDNLTAENREFVDERLKELKRQRDGLASRREELDRLELSQQAIAATTEEASLFLAALPGVLREGVPREKLVALRRCVERVWVGDFARSAMIEMRCAPGSGLTATAQCSCTFKAF